MKPGNNAGVALLLTLMILSFLAALGAALLASTTLDVWLVDNYRSKVQALQLAESSLEAAQPRVAVVMGDATLGPGTGFGVLLVSGRLRITDGMSWTGVIAAIGQGIVAYDAGAIVHVSGGVFTARILDAAGQRLAAAESVNFEITDADAINRASATFPYGWISIREN
jgi:hypothetical protein